MIDVNARIKKVFALTPLLPPRFSPHVEFCYWMNSFGDVLFPQSFENAAHSLKIPGAEDEFVFFSDIGVRTPL